MGDFNNVLQAQDRIGGNIVQEYEYANLVEMMMKTELFDKESVGDHFTWSNNQSNGIIYSRFDRVIANLEWHHHSENKTQAIMELGVSDHALRCLQEQAQRTITRRCFKFQNVVTTTKGFLTVINTNL